MSEQNEPTLLMLTQGNLDNIMNGLAYLWSAHPDLQVTYHLGHGEIDLLSKAKQHFMGMAEQNHEIANKMVLATHLASSLRHVASATHIRGRLCYLTISGVSGEDIARHMFWALPARSQMDKFKAVELSVEEARALHEQNVPVFVSCGIGDDEAVPLAIYLEGTAGEYIEDPTVAYFTYPRHAPHGSWLDVMRVYDHTLATYLQMTEQWNATLTVPSTAFALLPRYRGRAPVMIIVSTVSPQGQVRPEPLSECCILSIMNGCTVQTKAMYYQLTTEPNYRPLMPVV